MIRIWVLQTTSWLLLGGWLGAWGFFAFDVAPTAFQQLYAQGSAGSVVAPLLANLHNFGIFAGLGLAVLAAIRGQGWLLVALPLALAALCGASEYLVTPAINEVQPRSFGESQEIEAANRFSQLHEASRTIFGIVGVGIVGLVALHARPTADQSLHSRT